MSDYVKRKRGSMPTKKAIYNHWAERLGFMRNSEGLPCFACGGAGVIRAHIHASHQGGDESLDNLMLLCTSCHVAQEWICETEKGRKNWVEAIEENPPFFAVMMRRAEIANEIKTR